MAHHPANSNAARIQRLLDVTRSLDTDTQKDFFSPFQPHLDLVAADDVDTAARHHHPPRVVFSYTVQPEQCNWMGNMHGGATATLFDFCTSLAMALETGHPGGADSTGAAADADGATAQAIRSGRLGVSRTLAVTYLRPAPCGTVVLIECEQLHKGRRLSSLRGILRRRDDGVVLATCEHGKVVPDAKI